MINTTRVLGIVIGLGSVLALGCNTDRELCLLPQNVFLKMQFVARASDTGMNVKDTVLPFILLNPIDYPEQYMSEGLKNVSSFQIRLNPHQDSSRWYLQTDSTASYRRDTITFYYERDLHFISNACGYTYYYRLGNIRTATRTLADTIRSIDSAVIVQPNVNNEAGKAHVNIYFHRK